MKNPRGIIIGALAGALLGALIGWAYTSSADENQEKPSLSPTDYFRLGISLLGVAREVGVVVQRA